MAHAKTLDELIAEWSEERPELRSRLERARGLINNVRAVAPKEDGSLSFLIEGSQGITYIVTATQDGKTSCTCPDAENDRVSHCKHQLAVLLRASIKAPMPKDPHEFEVEIRQWAETGQPIWWVHDNGLFAIRMLLGEIDKLRSVRELVP